MRFCFAEAGCNIAKFVSLREFTPARRNIFNMCAWLYACMPRGDGRRITLLWRYVSCSADSLQPLREREREGEKREERFQAYRRTDMHPPSCQEAEKGLKVQKWANTVRGTRRMKSLVNPHLPPTSSKPTDA